ncbi:MAG TPA: YetF domain-containing protein [Anaerolineales bacterium]
MVQTIWMSIGEFLGLGNEELTIWQVGVRAVIIYVTAIVFVKIGEKRFMGKNTAFDMILGIILGSVLSRAVTGNAPFLATIGAGTVLVGVHWLFSVLSFHSDWFGELVKDKERTLIQDGEILWDNMRKSHISRKDLEMALYSNGKVTDPSQVKVARFERSGDISVIPRAKEKKTQIVEVTVQEGVQTVRIEVTET